MKLRWKTFAIMSVAVMSLVASLVVISQAITMQSTAAMEQKVTSQSVRRVLNVLSNELDDLNATTQDYATWDDTYAFVRDGNRNYIGLNLMDATFANLRLNIMLFVNISGQVMFGKAYDLNNETEIPVPKSLLSQVAANPLILRHDSMKTPVVGTILLPEGPLLIASTPILKSDGQGPVGGTLITGRFLDSTELAFLGKTTQLPLAVQVIADSPISSDFQTANLSISKESPIFVQPLNDERVAGYALLEDLYGNPILLLRADMPRDIYAQGLASTFYITVSLVVMGVIFGSLTILLLEKSVISRLTRLSTDVCEISKRGDFSARVSETGKDELSSLSEKIIIMLSALGQIEEKLKEEHVRTLSERAFSESVLTSLPGVFYMFDITGKMLRWNRNFESVSGYASDEIARMSFLDFFVGEEKELAQEKIQEVFERGASSVEAKLVSKDGHQTPLLFTGLLFRSENSSCLVGMGIDITERKKAERELLIKDNAITSSIDGMAIADLQGNMTYVNPVFVKMWGYDSDKEILGKSIAEMTEKGQSKEKAEEIMKALGTKGGWAGEITATRKDGSKFYAILSASLVKDGASKPICVLGSFVDITERNKVEQEKERLLHDLGKRAKELHCLYGVSKLLEKTEITLEQVMRGTVDLLPPAYQYPDIKCARIVFENQEFATENFRETRWKQQADIMVQGKKVGFVEICYLEEKPTIAEDSFLKEERDLVDALAERLGKIIERMKAEATLKEYRNLVDLSPDGIVAVDMKGIVTSVNSSLLKLIGSDSEEEIVGKPFTEIKTIQAQDIPRFAEMFSLLIKRESFPPTEFSYVRRDGTSRWAEAHPGLLMRDGKPVGVQVILRDATERKNVEQSLKESEERFRTVFDGAVEGILAADIKSRHLVFANPAMCELTGYSLEELLKLGVNDIHPKDDLPYVIGEFEKLAEGKTVVAKDIPVLRKDNRVVYCELSCRPLRFGKEEYLVAFFRDITERKEMLKKLEEYSQQLEKMVEHRTKQLKAAQEQLVKAERLATIGQVAAMVGHDLRNPLTGISGAAYYLKMKLDPKAEKKMMEMLGIIEKDVQYSNKIITDLMDYSREIKLELTETTPKSIIAESVSLIQIPEKVQLADSTLNGPKIKIDIDKMKRVFANFIKNAVEAMPQRGKLAISSRTSDGNVEFIFIDTGVGIAKEVLEKIWTPFFTTKAKGMGLGLAICKRIVEAHQGKISVESTVGEGTTFTVTIPLEPKPRIEGGGKVWVNIPESLLSTTTKA